MIARGTRSMVAWLCPKNVYTLIFIAYSCASSHFRRLITYATIFPYKLSSSLLEHRAPRARGRASNKRTEKKKPPQPPARPLLLRIFSHAHCHVAYDFPRSFVYGGRVFDNHQVRRGGIFPAAAPAPLRPDGGHVIARGTLH